MTEKLPAGTLCVVCEDVATGNHYSVPSCNGCKTFFRRAVVNNRMFTCMGNGDCPVNKGVRCACRHCRLKKCLLVGMDKKSIQNDRDRIGYTKRTRKSEKQTSVCVVDSYDVPIQNVVDPMLERLTTLENNLTLLLSRADIEPYASLDDALAAPSRFHQPINVRVMWLSRIIALYIDWAKSFACFRNLPHADKIALITNHASSYIIMCEAFRTPERGEKKLEGTVISGTSSDQMQGLLFRIKNDLNATNSEVLTMRLPTEYGSLPADYGTVIPQVLDTGSLDRRRDAVSGCPQKVISFSLSGLTPVMAAMIDYVMKPFRQLNISTTEFATLQAIMFFDPDTDGIDSASQRNVAAEQKKLLTALHRHIQRHYAGSLVEERYANILLRIPTIRKVAAKKNESLQMIDMLNLFAFNSLVKETALGVRSPSSSTLALGVTINGDYPSE
ncbi:unnamed protein product [Angiostrongylus costaricensis]|uniref:Nuclear receptor domain-containing protein n=1 Tax=Angiostrongylus costaricensis TaxID=334426 RepID=A0A0R3PSP7_ANGCS|nr:unnamed protein product [Angiostrongylus costaricensis]